MKKFIPYVTTTLSQPGYVEKITGEKYVKSSQTDKPYIKTVFSKNSYYKTY